MTVHAFLVGIEAYDEPDWSIRGPARNAVDIACWLRAIGVPGAQIHLFAWPFGPRPATGASDAATLEADLVALAADGVDVRRTGDAAAIERFWRVELPAGAAPGARLLTFWSGHGCTGPRRSRLLFCGDYRASLPGSVFNATNYLNALQSPRYAAFAEQIMFADVCGVYLAEQVRDEPEAFAMNPVRQLGYFATPEGRYAEGNDGRGQFTDLLLGVLRGIGGWPAPAALTAGIRAAAANAAVKPFRIGGFDEAGEIRESVGGSLPEDGAGATVRALFELIGGLDVVERVYLPHFLRTVEALGEPELAKAQGLLGILRVLASLRDGEVTRGLPRGLLQFLVRLRREPPLAEPIRRWLADHVVGQANTIAEIERRLDAAGEVLLLLVEAGADGDVAAFAAHRCNADFVLMPQGGAARRAVAGWAAFEREVQALLAPLIEAGDLGNVELQFAVDAPLLDRPFHLIPLAADDPTPLGEETVVVVRYRQRILAPYGLSGDDWRRSADALRAARTAGLAWLRVPDRGAIPRGHGPFLADFELPAPPATGPASMERKRVLVKLLKLGASFVYVPHTAPAQSWDTLAAELEALLRTEPTIDHFPRTIRRERAYANVLARDATLVWDDPLDNPFSAATGLGHG